MLILSHAPGAGYQSTGGAGRKIISTLRLLFSPIFAVPNRTVRSYPNSFIAPRISVLSKGGNRKCTLWVKEQERSSGQIEYENDTKPLKNEPRVKVGHTKTHLLDSTAIMPSW